MLMAGRLLGLTEQDDSSCTAQNGNILDKVEKTKLGWYRERKENKGFSSGLYCRKSDVVMNWLST